MRYATPPNWSNWKKFWITIWCYLGDNPLPPEITEAFPWQVRLIKKSNGAFVEGFSTWEEAEKKAEEFGGIELFKIDEGWVAY